VKEKRTKNRRKSDWASSSILNHKPKDTQPSPTTRSISNRVDPVHNPKPHPTLSIFILEQTLKQNLNYPPLSPLFILSKHQAPHLWLPLPLHPHHSNTAVARFFVFHLQQKRPPFPAVNQPSTTTKPPLLWLLTFLSMAAATISTTLAASSSSFQQRTLPASPNQQPRFDELQPWTTWSSSHGYYFFFSFQLHHDHGCCVAAFSASRPADLQLHRASSQVTASSSAPTKRPYCVIANVVLLLRLHLLHHGLSLVDLQQRTPKNSPCCFHDHTHIHGGKARQSG